MARPHNAPGFRITTWSLLAAALLMPASIASAVDWDGNFPVDGNYNGKIDGAANWDFMGLDILPTAGTGVEFLVNATYTVAFGVDFETALVNMFDGNVTFQNLGGVRTYAVNGTFTATNMLTLDGVNLDSGQSNDLSFHVEGGGEVLMHNGTTSRAGSIRIGDASTTDGTMTLDGMTFESTGISNIIAGGGGTGGLLTLQNGAVFDSSASSWLVGRQDGTLGIVRVLSGSELVVGGPLFMGNFDNVTGEGVLEVSGAGSSFDLLAGNDAFIGSDLNSTGRFTAASNATADFGGELNVRSNGTFENLGATVTVDGPAQIDGRFEQTGGSTVFNDTADFGSGATFVHFGGSIQFRDASTFGFTQDITIGGPNVPNAAVWDVDADVAFTQRMRLAGDTGTFATVTVADIGGVDAVLRNTANNTGADLAVGFNGSAQLFISDHGVVDIFDDVIIGQNAGSVGRIFVTGDGSAGFADRPTLLANRNGAGANLFVGINGEGLLNVAGGGLVVVGNDLVVMSSDVAGISSTATIGADPTLELPSNDNVTVGNNLLIGNVGGNGGTSSGLFWVRDNGAVVVGNTTHVRNTGELRADTGGLLVTDHLTTDAGSTLDIDGGIIQVLGGAATLNHGDLVINGDTADDDGQGVLQLLNGADAVLSSHLIVADAPGEDGLMAVNGTGTTLTQVPGLLDANIGAGGRGLLRITNGGLVNINHEVNIGQGIGAEGTVEVRGVLGGGRATLTDAGLGVGTTIHVGANGTTSLLDISDGGLVEVGGGVTIGGQAGTTFSGDHTLIIGGAAGGFAAELRTRVLNVNGSTATLEINDGALVVLTTAPPVILSLFVNGGGSTLDFNGGDVYTNQLFFLAGANIDWTGGTLHADLITGNELVNQGGTLAPGIGEAITLGTTTVDGDYTQTAAGTLEIEIAGTVQGTEFDFVDVDGQLSLAGTLEVLLLGPTPDVGDSFDILDWNTLAGTFDTLDLPGVGGGNTWDIDNLYTTGVIEVIRSGDLDGDGLVGVADIDVVLANWNQSVDAFDHTAGDVTGDGFVDGDDLQAVLDQFGNTTYPGTAMVPEPGTAALLGLMLLAGTRRRRR